MPVLLCGPRGDPKRWARWPHFRYKELKLSEDRLARGHRAFESGRRIQSQVSLYSLLHTVSIKTDICSPIN